MISRKSVEHLRAAIFIRNFNAKSEREAILKMLRALEGHPQVKDLSALSSAIFERQETDPPLMPGGIAFPHARTNSVSSLVMVVAACPEPIRFREMLIRLIFLIGVPKDAGADYLEMISFLARHLRAPDIVGRIVQAEDLPGFVAAFSELP